MRILPILILLLTITATAEELYVRLSNASAGPTDYTLTADQPQGADWSRAYQLPAGDRAPADAITFSHGGTTWYIKPDWPRHRSELRRFRAYWYPYISTAHALGDITPSQLGAIRTRAATIRTAKADGLTPEAAAALLHQLDTQLSTHLDIPRLYPD